MSPVLMRLRGQCGQRRGLAFSALGRQARGELLPLLPPSERAVRLELLRERDGVLWKGRPTYEPLAEAAAAWGERCMWLGAGAGPAGSCPRPRLYSDEGSVCYWLQMVGPEGDVALRWCWV